MKKVWPSDDQNAINRPNSRNRHSAVTNRRVVRVASGGKGRCMRVMVKARRIDDKGQNRVLVGWGNYFISHIEIELPAPHLFCIAKKLTDPQRCAPIAPPDGLGKFKKRAPDPWLFQTADGPSQCALMR